MMVYMGLIILIDFNNCMISLNTKIEKMKLKCSCTKGNFSFRRMYNEKCKKKTFMCSAFSWGYVD